MRVLQILTNLDLGGAQSFVVDLITRLRGRGVDVHLAYSSKGGRARLENQFLPGRLGAAGVPTYDVSAMVRSPAIVADALALRDLRALIRRARPDVVHTHMTKAGLVGRLAAILERVPAVVHTLHGWPLERRMNPVLRWTLLRMERHLAGRSSRLITVTPRLLRASLALGIGREHHYCVIRAGIDIQSFRSPDRIDSSAADRCGVGIGIPADAPVVGGIMALVTEKRPLDFVAVCARVAASEPHAHFVLVGDGPLRPLVEASIGRASLAERFHIVGLQENVSRYLQRLDVLLLTSSTEGLPRVIMEANVCEVPVVATDVGGVSDLVEPGVTGFLAKCGDVDALARHTAALLRDDHLARRIARNAASRVSNQFDIESAVDDHQELYRGLMKARRGARPGGARELQVMLAANRQPLGE